MVNGAVWRVSGILRSRVVEMSLRKSEHQTVDNGRSKDISKYLRSIEEVNSKNGVIMALES